MISKSTMLNSKDKHVKPTLRTKLKQPSLGHTGLNCLLQNRYLGFVGLSLFACRSGGAGYAVLVDWSLCISMCLHLCAVRVTL